MAGMIGQQAAAAAAPAQEEPVEPAVEPGETQEEQPAQPPAPGQPDPNAQEEEPTPQEQEAFTRFEIAAKKVIHDKEENFDNIMKILQLGKDKPEQALAQAALIVFGVIDSNTKGGVPEFLILRGAEVCLDLIIDLAEKAGLMQIDEAMANRSLVEMVKQAGVMYDFDTKDMEAQMLKAMGQQAPAQQAPGQPPAEPAPAEQPPAAAPAAPPEQGVM